MNLWFGQDAWSTRIKLNVLSSDTAKVLMGFSWIKPFLLSFNSQRYLTMILYTSDVKMFFNLMYFFISFSVLLLTPTSNNFIINLRVTHNREIRLLLVLTRLKIFLWHFTHRWKGTEFTIHEQPIIFYTIANIIVLCDNSKSYICNLQMN